MGDRPAMSTVTSRLGAPARGDTYATSRPKVGNAASAFQPPPPDLRARADPGRRRCAGQEAVGVSGSKSEPVSAVARDGAEPGLGPPPGTLAHRFGPRAPWSLSASATTIRQSPSFVTSSAPTIPPPRSRSSCLNRSPATAPRTLPGLPCPLPRPRPRGRRARVFALALVFEPIHLASSEVLKALPQPVCAVMAADHPLARHSDLRRHACLDVSHIVHSEEYGVRHFLELATQDAPVGSRPGRSRRLRDDAPVRPLRAGHQPSNPDRSACDLRLALRPLPDRDIRPGLLLLGQMCARTCRSRARSGRSSSAPSSNRTTAAARPERRSERNLPNAGAEALSTPRR